MFHALLEQVRREVSGERALATVKALVGFHRVQASPGYDQANEWLAAEIERAGLEPVLERVPGDGRTRFLGQLMPEGWSCERAVAILIDGQRRETVCDYAQQRLSLILRSAPAHGRYPLVALEDGTEAAHYEGVDVRGRVVLTSGAVHRVHELAVIERGAAGLLADGRRLVHPVRGEKDDRKSIAYTSFWWPEDAVRGWGFVISPDQGARLRSRLAQGQHLELEVAIESRAFPTTIPLLSARLPGTGTEEVWILSHLCHPQPSANDNASGVAANLETARALAALRKAAAPWRRAVRFIWIPELTGTFAWLARHAQEARATVAALNLDMVGEDQALCGSTLLIEHPPHFAAGFAEELLGAIRAEAVDWVRSYSGPGHYSMTRMAEVPYAGGSDHAVLIDPAIGVPCPMLIQWPDRYYHSSLDTPDKTDPASLALAARCAATYAGFLAQAGEAEAGWLLDRVARGARTRLLRAVDAPDAARRVRREQARGRQALESVGRLGIARPAIERAQASLDEFVRREIPVRAADPPVGGASWRPLRRIGAPLHYQRHLLAGYASLSPARKEAWRALEATTPDALLLSEIAWYACDGRRTLADITERVWLETGRDEPAFLEAFFRYAEGLDLCRLEGAEVGA